VLGWLRSCLAGGNLITPQRNSNHGDTVYSKENNAPREKAIYRSADTGLATRGRSGDAGHGPLLEPLRQPFDVSRVEGEVWSRK